ncbi:NAD(P)/FAD-dependent oxidoreductase [Pseudarthrobacter sp. P1]|uniref:NAD(P)/FAD-dependent oxidoreductase n=1 Tax=Pseudarthrobacter sp. P1 TaxID=3418418 RepID=UPI003CF994F3
MVPSQVIVLGGGFAGMAAAEHLGRKGIDVLLIDKNNYHQFQPLLYQVATAQLGASVVARSLRSIFRGNKHVRVLTAEATAIDPAARTVTVADGTVHQAQVLVIASGAEANFFNTPGVERYAYPLYSVQDAVRLGAKLFAELDDADAAADESGGVPVVVVGGGPTGVETAGAIAEAFKYSVPGYFSAGLAERCSVHLVDLLPTVLAPFSKKSQSYAKARLAKVGVQLRLGVGVSEVTPDSVTLADGTQIATRIVIWAGGLKAGALVAGVGLPQGRGGRIDAATDLTVPGFDGVYVLGDCANLTDAAGHALPQLGSVAQQSGKWAARNIHADLTGGQREPFHYLDKGVMAMVGRGGAVAELGAKRFQMQGPVAFLAWLAVHAALLSGTAQRASAIGHWAVGYLTHRRTQIMVERPDR